MASRRSVLTLIGAGAGAVLAFRGGAALVERFGAAPEFEPLESPPGFRRLAAQGSSTGAFDPFAGLGSGAGTADPGAAALLDDLRSDPCPALFGEARARGGVPVASFSDYFCPYCRVQMRRLAEMEAEMGGRIAIAWHELPLLGQASVMAARAALAAKRQGAYLAFHERLMISPFRPGPDYLARLSENIGIDPGQLLEDMNGPEVARELAVSAALSRLFGFIGTPAMVVGRTVIQGEILDTALRRVIALEEGAGGPC